MAPPEEQALAGNLLARTVRNIAVARTGLYVRFEPPGNPAEKKHRADRIGLHGLGACSGLLSRKS